MQHQVDRGGDPDRGIPVGQYRVRVSPSQMQRMGLRSAASPAVSIEPDGWLVSGIEIEVSPL